MANNRANIRSALKTMLTGQTDAGSNVYTNRESRLWQSELPAIIISTPEEPVTPESLSSRRYIRDLVISLEVKIEASESVDDTLDALVADIEDLIDADPSIDGTVLSCVQKSTEVRVDSEGEKDIGVATITFECKYIS